MSFRKLVYVLFLFSLLTGCSSSLQVNDQTILTTAATFQACPPVDTPLPTWEEFVANAPTQTGIGYGMGRDDIEGADMIGLQTYVMPVNKATTAHFHIAYPKQDSGTIPVRLMTLIDQEQLTTQKYKDFILHPGDETILDIPIPALQPGIHELLVILLFDVEKSPDASGEQTYVSSRFTLIVQDDDEKEITLDRDYTYLEPTEKREIDSEQYGPLLLLGFDAQELRVWNWPDSYKQVKVGDQLPFYIFTGYNKIVSEDQPDIKETETLPFAIVAFLDYIQTPIIDDAVSFYGFVENNNYYSRINAVAVAEELGHHDLLVVRVNHPNVPMCQLFDKQLLDYVSVDRVGIEVIE